jgi:hypothetical protein
MRLGGGRGPDKPIRDGGFIGPLIIPGPPPIGPELLIGPEFPGICGGPELGELPGGPPDGTPKPGGGTGAPISAGGAMGRFPNTEWFMVEGLGGGRLGRWF